MSSPLFTDAERLGVIRSLDDETFETGQAEQLRGIFTASYGDAELGELTVETTRPTLRIRQSDVDAHALQKGGVITRASDGQAFRISRIESDSVGFALLVLRK